MEPDFCTYSCFACKRVYRIGCKNRYSIVYKRLCLDRILFKINSFYICVEQFDYDKDGNSGYKIYSIDEPKIFQLKKPIFYTFGDVNVNIKYMFDIDEYEYEEKYNITHIEAHDDDDNFCDKLSYEKLFDYIDQVLHQCYINLSIKN